VSESTALGKAATFANKLFTERPLPNTRQRLCRVYIGLCRVPEALGKEAASGSGTAKIKPICRFTDHPSCIPI